MANDVVFNLEPSIHQDLSNNKCWHLILNTKGSSCKSYNKSSFSLDQRIACKRHKKVFYFWLILNDTNNLIILPFSFPKLAFCFTRSIATKTPFVPGGSWRKNHEKNGEKFNYLLCFKIRQMVKAKKIFLKVKEMGRGNWDLERVEKQEASEKIKS